MAPPLRGEGKLRGISRLPGYVAREFDDYLKCGRLQHGFLRVCCDTCHHEKLVAFSCKRRGFCRGRPVHRAEHGGW
ncbi:MAG: transposase zinc-binding domain-containing protein [Pseudomonadota bacterium]